MAVVTTGSTVLGTVPGMRKHLGGGGAERVAVNMLRLLNQFIDKLKPILSFFNVAPF